MYTLNVIHIPDYAYILCIYQLKLCAACMLKYVFLNYSITLPLVKPLNALHMQMCILTLTHQAVY